MQPYNFAFQHFSFCSALNATAPLTHYCAKSSQLKETLPYQYSAYSSFCLFFEDLQTSAFFTPQESKVSVIIVSTKNVCPGFLLDFELSEYQLKELFESIL